MGMFDRVFVDCPNCGTEIEFQSKAGECQLRGYTLADAPDDIIQDIRDDVEVCRGCNSRIGLTPPFKLQPYMVRGDGS